MSARRVVDTKIEMPPNPSFLDFLRSDGNASNWPRNTTREVDHEGCVNFHEPVLLEDGRAMRWRILVAEAVAAKLQMPEGPSYVLRSWPDGYRLYDHHKGRETDPRHDLYLFGVASKRFRSVNEFVPHAIWLIQSGSTACSCKYCSKKTQKEITASMSDILRSTPGLQSPSPSRPKSIRDKQANKFRDPLSRLKGKQREHPVYASVQRTLKPLKAAPNILKQPMLAERSNDLRAVQSRTSMSLRRWFREGEVVWCALDPQIPTPTEGVYIEFWPGVIDEIGLKSIPVRRKKSPTPPHASSLGAEASSSATQSQDDDENGRGTVLESNGDSFPFSISQFTKYKVHLLAVSHSYTVLDSQVLPYQSYMPTTELIQEMIDYPAPDLIFDRNIISNFNPHPGPTPPNFKDAVAPFAWAIQIASVLSSYWCLTDEYEMNYALPTTTPQAPSSPLHPNPTPPPPSQSISTHGEPLSLQSALEAAARHNAQISQSVSQSLFRNVTAVDPTMSQSELQQTAKHVLGVPQSSPDQVTQTRFQGMWWGSERLWVDDFIRLKIPRRTLAPDGAESILPPAGPGARARAEWADRDLKDIGAGARGLFMRLDGLVAVDVPVKGDSAELVQEARAYGTLYELVDEDWEDQNDVSKAHLAYDVPQSISLTGLPEAGISQPVVDGAIAINVAAAPQGAGKPSGSVSTVSQAPMSGPVPSSFLPQPPIGYRFRPILKPGHECTICLGIISGRYYPRILSHPRLRTTIDIALSRPLELGGVAMSNNLWALEGLSAGYHNSVDPSVYKPSRANMLQDADREALFALQRHAAEKLANSNGERPVEINGEDAMDVDDIYA